MLNFCLVCGNELRPKLGKFCEEYGMHYIIPANSTFCSDLCFDKLLKFLNRQKDYYVLRLIKELKEIGNEEKQLNKFMTEFEDDR